MAVIWQKRSASELYEVRTAGNSLRLYTNGIFHSQWNPKRPLAGHLWDLLFLPALFHKDAPSIGHCLVLGVGGGAVINLLNTFLAVKKITAVDLDPIHLKIAEKFFLDKKDNVTLIEAEARNYLSLMGNKKVDFLIDDLFCGSDTDKSDAVRPITVDAEWLTLLASRLKADGILAINFEGLTQMKKALTRTKLKVAGFQSRVYFRHPRYENVIAVCFKSDKNLSRFNTLLDGIKADYSRAAVGDLRYQLES